MNQDVGYDPDIGLLGREKSIPHGRAAHGAQTSSAINGVAAEEDGGVAIAIDSSPIAVEIQQTKPAANIIPDNVIAFAPQQLIDRCMGNLAFAERLLASYEKRFSVDVSQLERSLEAQNPQQLASIAHQLKGASANISAPRLQQVAAKIEELGRADCLDTVAEHLESLQEEWRRFIACRGQLKVDKSLEEPRR